MSQFFKICFCLAKAEVGVGFSMRVASSSSRAFLIFAVTGTSSATMMIGKSFTSILSLIDLTASTRCHLP